ncbi:hypothetical protein KIN20_008933 [Parelaphostrongylus tenuis]|uniref:Uncharacterized protein n=1 Tax=Parelaphostrongylus tenuis TaxID=148309 RepID=A0AAD5M8P4_PARTN|nr:hypothetical protein KIN20_008933 [Parelaphostrongylus tenuis]
MLCLKSSQSKTCFDTLLQLHIDDEVVFKESDDKEGMEATVSSSQDSDLNDGAPTTSGNIGAVGDRSNSVVTSKSESFDDSRIGVQNNAFRDCGDPVNFCESLHGQCLRSACGTEGQCKTHFSSKC